MRVQTWTMGEWNFKEENDHEIWTRCVTNRNSLELSSHTVDHHNGA